MKIITWNVNGYRSITGQNPSKKYDVVTKENRFFQYVKNEEPDIICIQEVKADLEQINEELITPPEYNYYYNTATSKKGYSGVAVFSKLKPKSINKSLGIEKFDVEGRLLELDFDDFILMNIYFPKGYADNERLDFKLEFYNEVYKHLKNLRKKGRKLIVSGDYNTAHKEIDLARPKENIGTSGFMPVERVKLDELIEMGFTDTFRVIINEPGHYTWWSQRGRARENNIGWRIDYHFISNDLNEYLKNAKQQPEIEGSDHCPVVIELSF